MKIAITPNQLAQAQQIRSRVDKVVDQVKALDNQGADLAPAAGDVKIASSGNVSLQKEGMYVQDVLSADVQFEPTSGKTREAQVDIKSYYNTSYGPSAADVLHYSKESRTEKDGLLGLLGQPRQVDVYTVQRDDYWNTNNRKEVARFDEQGNLLSLKSKEYAQTFPSALKEVVTTPAGIGLTVAAGLLMGVPGSLGNALFGPTAGVVAAGVTAVGLAYYKTRAW